MSKIRLVSIKAFKHYHALMGSDSNIARATGVSPAAVGKWEENGMPVWAAVKLSSDPSIPFPYADFGLDPKVFLNHALDEITNQAA